MVAFEDAPDMKRFSNPITCVVVAIICTMPIRIQHVGKI